MESRLFASVVSMLGLAITFAGCLQSREAYRDSAIESRVQETLVSTHVESRARETLVTIYAEATLAANSTSSALPLIETTPTPSSGQAMTRNTLTFSGYDWHIKSSRGAVGPGPNRFSSRLEDVYVDDEDRLHLTISQQNRAWYATEVINSKSLGYGLYTFHLEPLDPDPNIVLGLFTWDGSAPEENYREIDIEVSRWGDVDNENLQYVVQPWDRPGNISRFEGNLADAPSTHSFLWRPDTITFQSSYGHHLSEPPAAQIIQSWVYEEGDIPSAGKENLRINLWLRRGQPPVDGRESEVVISHFHFTTLEELHSN